MAVTAPSLRREAAPYKSRRSTILSSTPVIVADGDRHLPSSSLLSTLFHQSHRHHRHHLLANPLSTTTMMRPRIRTSSPVLSRNSFCGFTQRPPPSPDSSPVRRASVVAAAAEEETSTTLSLSLAPPELPQDFPDDNELLLAMAGHLDKAYYLVPGDHSSIQWGELLNTFNVGDGRWWPNVGELLELAAMYLRLKSDYLDMFSLGKCGGACFEGLTLFLFSICLQKLTPSSSTSTA